MPSLEESSTRKWTRCQEELLELGYDVSATLGSGSWGTVVKALLVDSPEDLVAIKIIDRSLLDETSWTSIEREIDAMSALYDHPHIVKLENVLETNNFIFLVLEFCSEGDLLSLVQKTGTGLKEAQARLLFKQVLHATVQAHKKGYVHRDIKLENIFLTEDLSARLGDWGFARQMSEGTKVDEYCGSVHYSAPEICLGKPYDGYRVDVWSLGVTLYSMVSGVMPFFGAKEDQIVQQILLGSYQMIPTFSESLQNLISQMLEPSPSDRISAEAMLEHPWIRGYSVMQARRLPTIASIGKSYTHANVFEAQPVPRQGRRGSIAVAIPKLDLRQVVIPPPSVEMIRPLASARRTARYSDLPQRKSPRLRSSPTAPMEFPGRLAERFASATRPGLLEVVRKKARGKTTQVAALKETATQRTKRLSLEM